MKKILLLLMVAIATVGVSAQNQFLLSVSCNEGGEVTFDGQTVRNGMKQVSVNRNQSVTMNILADEAYEVEKVTLNETEVTTDLYRNTYTIAQIQDDMDFRVVFARKDRLKGLTAINVDIRDVRKTLEVPAMYYQPVIGKVGSGNDEEYHYINPETGEIFDSDWTDGTSDFLFDSGDMTPQFTFWGVHSWYDFQAMYGYDGIDHPFNTFYRMYLSEYTRLKTSQSISPTCISYQLNPVDAKLDGTSFDFHTNVRMWGDFAQARNGNQGFAVPLCSWLDGNSNTLDDGVLTVQFAIPPFEEYLHQIARNANSYETWMACFEGIFAEKDFGITIATDNFLSSTDSLNTIILQAKQYGQETVASDEVTIVPALIFLTGIADNNSDVNMAGYGGVFVEHDDYGNPVYDFNNHLWKQVRTAARNKAVHTVPYNRSIDLMPFIETHYMKLGSHLNFMSGLEIDLVMTPELFRQLGLRYEFSMVDYDKTYYTNIPGEYYTMNETSFATMDVSYNSEADYGVEHVIITPRSIDGNGDTILDEVAKRDAIDHEPLVRITVLDKRDQTVLVGYMKLLITDNLEPTGIDNNHETINNNRCFDLQGRELSNGYWLLENGYCKKGVYIHNGKKVVLK